MVFSTGWQRSSEGINIRVANTGRSEAMREIKENMNRHWDMRNRVHS